MTTAFVLGNGRSREPIDLAQLKTHGPVYGCNALYRTFTPNVLIATDRPIATAIQDSGYAKKHRFYTRKPLPESGAHRLDNKYQGFSSGPNAVALACLDGYHCIYLLGFDLGTTNGQFNNLYADTQFYKKSQDPPTFSGNWVKQIIQICGDFPAREFIRVEGPQSARVAGFDTVKNLRSMSLLEFQTLLNTAKGQI